MVNINERYRERAEKVLLATLFILFSLYVINVVGNIEGVSEFLGKRRYLNALWVVLGLYLVVSKGKIEWQFFWGNVCLIIPISVASLFLYFYHNHVFDLSYVKYAFLLILVGSIICKNNKFRLREFFVVNSLACLVIFFSAIYQISILNYPIPNGDLNQNIFACFVVAIGNVSIFAVLYKNLNKIDRAFFAMCGVLAIWVALRTTCRTAYVAEVVVACLFSCLAYKRFEWSRKKVIGFLSLIVVLLFLVVIASPSITEYKFKAISPEISVFLGLEDKETTNSSVGLRLAMWKAAFVDVIPNHWCFGIGDIRKLDWLTLLPGSNIDKEYLKGLPHFHNEGINILVMGGLLLFIVSNWLLYRLFVVAKTEPVQLCLLVGTVVWGMTEVAFRHKPFLVVFLSIWLLYECAIRNEQYQEARNGSVLMQCWRGCELIVFACLGHAKKIVNWKTKGKSSPTESLTVSSSEALTEAHVKLPISVVLLTHNEECNICDCLDSCCKFAQEIIVVDDASTDKTIELAQKYPEVKVFKRSLNGDFGAQKSFGIAQAMSEWIFLIDADERVTPQLEAAIRQYVECGEKTAYWVQRENHFKNMVVRHGTMRPDWVLRLIPREGATVEGCVHEKVQSIFSQKKITEGRLVHFPYRSWDQVYEKTNQYSRLAAIKLQEQGRPCGFFSHVVFHPIWAFFRAYFFNLGFLDGKAGFIFAANHAVYTLLKYVRYYQLKHFNGEL